MTLEERKSNMFFDKTGKQILVGDLLKVYHFKSRRRKEYMYHVVVMEETFDFPVMACREYYRDKPHYRLYVLCNNKQRVYKDAEIIHEKDWQADRIRIKIEETN